MKLCVHALEASGKQVGEGRSGEGKDPFPDWESLRAEEGEFLRLYPRPFPTSTGLRLRRKQHRLWAGVWADGGVKPGLL